MPYRLHVTAGPSLDLLTHSLVPVNDEDHPIEIRSSHFWGRITVRVKDFLGGNSQPPSSSPYFSGKRATFSLQCQGQYGDPLQPKSLTADDLMFGIVLREPLSDTPSLGLTLIERTMRFFWPIMECNLQESSPWILSPMFATVSRVHIHTRADHKRSFDKYLHPPVRPEQLPPWPGIMPDAESENAIAALDARAPRVNCDGPPSRSRAVSGSGCHDLLNPPPPPPPRLFSRLSLSPRPRTVPSSGDPRSRKKHFSSPLARKAVRIDPSDVITTIFHNSFIDFRDLSLTVPGLPFRIELGKYMVGRPAQYVCRDREGKIFWAIVFTILWDE
ncbi:hypothetical protein FRC08_011792 [Ceratobasidium sp. 394]|nr:hypothetical protein FRC08_011792 [Ceratobasidium sp. 394]